MIRNAFVLLLVLVCAIYIAHAFPDLTGVLKKSADDSEVLFRTERGVGRRGRPHSGHGRGGRPAGHGGRPRWRPGGRGGQGRPRWRPRWRPGGRWRGDDSSSEDQDSSSEDWESTARPTTKIPTTTTSTRKPTTTSTTTTTTTTTPTTTTTTTTTTTKNPLDIVTVGDATVITGDSDDPKPGCILVAGIIQAPGDVDCQQITLNNAQYFAHTQCGLYCQCGSSGAVVKPCPEGLAWDTDKRTCTTEAFGNC